MVKRTRPIIQQLRKFELISVQEKTVESSGYHGVPFSQSDDQLIASVVTAYYGAIFDGAVGLLQLYLEDDASIWKDPLNYQQGRVAYQDFMSCYNAVGAA